jgi:hypothetical protein
MSQEMKNALFHSITTQYRGLSESVKQTSIADHLKMIILKDLDNAYLWIKEAFAFMPAEKIAESKQEELIVE